MRQKRNWPATPARWPACAKPSTAPTAVITAVLALCLTACASTRRANLSQTQAAAALSQTDSLRSEIRLVRTRTVPRSEVRIQIPADSLLRLPPQASYNGKSGQASLSVSRDKDVITVYASCDSLQTLVEYYERTSSAWQERYEEMAGLYEAEVKQRPNPVRTFFYGFGAGILLSVLTITIIILKRKNNGKQ